MEDVVQDRGKLRYGQCQIKSREHCSCTILIHQNLAVSLNTTESCLITLNSGFCHKKLRFNSDKQEMTQYYMSAMDIQYFLL